MDHIRYRVYLVCFRQIYHRFPNIFPSFFRKVPPVQVANNFIISLFRMPHLTTMGTHQPNTRFISRLIIKYKTHSSFISISFTLVPSVSPVSPHQSVMPCQHHCVMGVLRRSWSGAGAGAGVFWVSRCSRRSWSWSIVVWVFFVDISVLVGW